MSTNLPKVSKEIRYPREPNKYYYLITFIEVKNIGDGGIMYIKEGGTGFEYTVFHLETPKGVRFEFQICVYGYLT